MGSVPPQLSTHETIPVPGGVVAVAEGVGGLYLVVELPGLTGPYWVCAPVSDRVVECVRTGRASPWAVVHHSVTGTVDIYRTLRDGSVDESVVLCAMLSDRDLPGLSFSPAAA